MILRFHLRNLLFILNECIYHISLVMKNIVGKVFQDWNMTAIALQPLSKDIYYQVGKMEITVLLVS